MDPFDERKAETVRQYIHQAEEDSAVVESLLGEEPGPADTIRQYAARAAENYLKAFLVWHRIEFPDTRDLDELLDRVARVDDRLARSLRGCNVLTPFAEGTDASQVRPERSAVYAQDAVNLVGEVREEIRYALQDFLGHEEERMRDEGPNLVTVFASADELGFELAKQLLKGSGIEYFSRHQALPQLFGHHELGVEADFMLGRYQLQVREEDAEEAREILAELEEEGSPEEE